MHGTTHLDDDTARDVVAAVIDDAPRFTTGQLMHRLRKLCIDVDPDQAAKRYNQAVEQRSITTHATEAGTTNLFATDLAPDRAAAVMAHLNHTARTLRNQGDPRTMDQLRADVFMDLLDGTHPGCKTSGSGGVNLTADLETLTYLAEHPGELAGYGPVIADIARQVTEHQTHSQWTYTITDPHTGMLIDAGTTRRRPTAAQRRYVQARDRVCVFPGCRMPATDCDMDHIDPHSHGRPHLRRQPRPRLPPRPHHPHQTRLDLPNASPTATTNGPPNSVTSTPPAATRHPQTRHADREKARHADRAGIVEIKQGPTTTTSTPPTTNLPSSGPAEADQEN